MTYLQKNLTVLLKNKHLNMINLINAVKVAANNKEKTTLKI